ncbi:hypothetical protein CH63R_14325 [Colletotrichum higginsianum IMI 349063]|uniref:Uncharacterized protein n=1 Tax=Colletotrichum higginsianum (strain IMI 349063) TaxID=759273 RepID=A0A1B7XTJ6_COLHI|nr:hypothetical protein CH63R_14325 [Colletotrichum higginsianum IMI 349063]OBR03099.1 hypothetical protein CH63R_14325 [Colletotrichum higginsianum IMI 349063]
MDPFNRLPAEIRTEILVSTWCPCTNLHLIQASPVMLQQYTVSKEYIARKLLAADFDNGMMQDAIAIILFPLESAADFKTLARHHCRSWATQQFTNPLYQPLESRDQDLINRISKLHQGLMFYIEDFLTKATAVFPPREYVCLPSQTESQLRFKGQAVSSRFNAANLTGLERKRLLRAFLRYQLNSLMDEDIQDLFQEALYQHSGRKFQLWDLQAILCVSTYLETLYGAIFAQCSDSWLPEIILGSTSSHPPGLLYPDSLYIEPGAYASDMGCERSCIAHALSDYGFDLVTILLRSAGAGQPDRDRLKKWIMNFRSRRGSRWRDSHYLLRGHDSLGAVKEDSQNGPGMYQMLHSRIIPNYPTITDTYLQRAWVFFDDARFYPLPSPDAKPHFPTEDEALDERFQNTKKDEDWWDYPWQARARHRSQKWHNEQRGISPEKTKVEDNQDSELEEECQVSLPDLVKGKLLSPLRPFWQ